MFAIVINLCFRIFITLISFDEREIIGPQRWEMRIVPEGE